MELLLESGTGWSLTLLRSLFEKIFKRDYEFTHDYLWKKGIRYSVSSSGFRFKKLKKWLNYCKTIKHENDLSIRNLSPELFYRCFCPRSRSIWKTEIWGYVGRKLRTVQLDSIKEQDKDLKRFRITHRWLPNHFDLHITYYIIYE